VDSPDGIYKSAFAMLTIGFMGGMAVMAWLVNQATEGKL
jgi:hypothetical protein